MAYQGSLRPWAGAPRLVMSEKLLRIFWKAVEGHLEVLVVNGDLVAGELGAGPDAEGPDVIHWIKKVRNRLKPA